MISINYRDSRPIYEQIRESFIRMLVSGGVAAGEKLPSVRELAQQLAINPNTIQRAYRELEAQGYIQSVPGKGSFACAQPEAATAKKQELLSRFSALAQELRSLGVTQEELENAIKEEQA